MSTLNAVTLIGYLGADVDLRALPDGTAVANFRMATNEVRRKAQSQLDEYAEWHRVVVYGQQATLAAKYLAKGSQCVCTGRLRTRKWSDKANVEHWTTEIIAERVGFLGRAPTTNGKPEGLQDTEMAFPPPSEEPPLPRPTP